MQAAVNAKAFGAVLDPIMQHIVNPVVGLMFGIAVLVFVYGVLQMVINGEDAEAKDNGKRSILWGLIGMLIMVSAWGIIYLIANTVKAF